MARIKQIILVVSLLFVGAAYAGWTDKQGNSIPDSDGMKSVGKLAAQMVITDDPENALKNWGTPSETVYFPAADKIERNKAITAFAVFGGCAVNASGNCDLNMQITIYQPDGSVYSELPSMEVWSGKPAPSNPAQSNRGLGLSVEYMLLIIEEGEQLGKYKLDTTVTDSVSGNTMLLTSYFTAVEATE